MASLRFAMIQGVTLIAIKIFYEFNLPKYSFTIVYVIEDTQKIIVIIAIYHQKRTPGNKYRDTIS